MIRRWWTWVVTELSRTERGTSLALFRIAVGLTIAGELLLTWSSGAATLLWHDRAHGGYRTAMTSDHWLFDWVGDPTASTVDGLFWITLAATGLVVVGLGTRVAAPVALFGLQALFSLSSGAGGGHDRMFTIALFVLALSSADTTLSLRCWLTERRLSSSRLVHAWPRVWITWNLALIYTSAGLVKLSAEWLPHGELRAVYNTVMTPHWARADWTWLWGPLFPLTQLGTAVTVFWESSWLVVPFWLILRARPRQGLLGRIAAVDLRSFYVFVGLLMHGALLVFTNLGPFTAITWAWYVVLYRPEEWEALAARLRPTQQPQPST